MSTQIRAQIQKLETSGLLVRYEPHRSRRRLFLGPDAQKDLADQTSATNMLVGKGFILAALDRWTLGKRVYGKTRGGFLDRLDPPPPDVWEIRVTEPIVQARLFGRFAEADTLLLTKFHTRTMLGDRGSRGWNDAMNHCDQCWNTLFPGIPCFTAAHIHEYVTENCDDFPI